MQTYCRTKKSLWDEVDMDRVEHLREDATKGKYAVPPDKVAERIIDYLLMIGFADQAEPKQ